jgi:hypothetical protein
VHPEEDAPAGLAKLVQQCERVGCGIRAAPLGHRAPSFAVAELIVVTLEALVETALPSRHEVAHHGAGAESDRAKTFG